MTDHAYLATFFACLLINISSFFHSCNFYTSLDLFFIFLAGPCLSVGLVLNVFVMDIEGNFVHFVLKTIIKGCPC